MKIDYATYLNYYNREHVPYTKEEKDHIEKVFPPIGPKSSFFRVDYILRNHLGSVYGNDGGISRESEVVSSTNKNSVECILFIGNKAYCSITKITDEYFIIYYNKQNSIPSNNQINSSSYTYHLCDQFDELMEFIIDFDIYDKNALSILLSKKESLKYIKENTYYYSTNDFNPNKKIVSMSDSSIEYLNNLYDIAVDTSYVDADSYIFNGIRYLSILDYSCIDVYEYEDEWFEVEYISDTGSGFSYWCDQLDGLVRCINKIHKNIKEHIDHLGELKHIKEYNQYYIHEDPRHPSELPPDVEDGRPISITDKDINYIKRGLGIDTQKDTVKLVNRSRLNRKPNNVYAYYFYYNIKNGDVGNLNTIGNAPKKNTREVSITSYTDEWFKVKIDDRVYWCDQIDGVVQCVKDSINKEIYYNYINESKIGDSYHQITRTEFDKLSYRNLLDFTKSDHDWIYRFDEWDEFGLTTEDDHLTSFSIVTNTREINGEITKVSDEWYLVEVGVKYFYSKKGPFFYKCDQLDGVGDLLKKLKRGFPKSTLTINDI